MIAQKESWQDKLARLEVEDKLWKERVRQSEDVWRRARNESDASSRNLAVFHKEVLHPLHACLHDKFPVEIVKLCKEFLYYEICVNCSSLFSSFGRCLFHSDFSYGSTEYEIAIPWAAEPKQKLSDRATITNRPSLNLIVKTLKSEHYSKFGHMLESVIAQLNATGLVFQNERKANLKVVEVHTVGQSTGFNLNFAQKQRKDRSRYWSLTVSCNGVALLTCKIDVPMLNCQADLDQGTTQANKRANQGTTQSNKRAHNYSSW